MAIVIEERCLPSSLLQRVQSGLAEFVVESLRVRPVYKTLQILKKRLVAVPGVFTVKEATVPQPVAINLGFELGGIDDNLEAEELFRAGVEKAVAAAFNMGICGFSMSQKFKELRADLGLQVTDPSALRVFAFPEISLAIKTRASETAEMADSLVEHGLDGLLESWEAPVVSNPNPAVVEQPKVVAVKQLSVFDGSAPEIYLEWRSLFLERVPLSRIGSRSAVDDLIAAAPLEDVKVLAERFQGSQTARFLCLLNYLNGRFETKQAQDYVVAEIAKAEDPVRIKRLVTVFAAFIDEPRGERAKMREFVDAQHDEFSKARGNVVLSFGDERFAIFRARYNAFLKSSD